MQFSPHHLENADVLKASRRRVGRWMLLLVVLAGLLAAGLFLRQVSKPVSAPNTHSKPSPEAQSGLQTGFADPCGLDVVICPDEQPGYAPEPQADPSIPTTIYATVFTYHAAAEQTDSDPCTTADGTHICPLPPFGVVANNCLDFGTRVLIREETYFVHDRMNSRWGCDVFDVLTDGDVYKLLNEPVVVL